MCVGEQYTNGVSKVGVQSEMRAGERLLWGSSGLNQISTAGGVGSIPGQ